MESFKKSKTQKSLIRGKTSKKSTKKMIKIKIRNTIITPGNICFISTEIISKSLEQFQNPVFSLKCGYREINITRCTTNAWITTTRYPEGIIWATCQVFKQKKSNTRTTDFSYKYRSQIQKYRKNIVKAGR